MQVFVKSFLIFLSIFLSVPLVYSAPQVNCSNIQASEEKFIADSQYNEFIASLDSLKEKDKANQLCLNYYKAHARYLQLKYLEEKQSWDDYFANGNTYRDELEKNAQQVVAQADASDPLKVKSRLLLWQFHNGQQDAFTAQALDDLILDINTYAKLPVDPDLIKDIASNLFTAGEKPQARKIYKLYVDQLVAEKITDPELKNIAAGFYKEGNLELAESVYDIYIERISTSLAPEKLIPELFEIASLFVYQPHGDGLASASAVAHGLPSIRQSQAESHKATGFYDMAYAEKVYVKIEGLAQKDAFSQETIYLRAFNLEKLGDYKLAAELYSQLTQIYPDSKYFDEAIYKIGMINIYVLANINESRKNFKILSAKTVISPHVISSFYQLGVLAQWENDLVKAQEYYDLLLKTAVDKYVSIVVQAKDRVKEIQESKPLSYNLKSSLDLSLKNENQPTEMGKAEVQPSAYVLAIDQKATISSVVNMPQSGCNQVELQYLWSGDLGSATPSAMEGSFQPTYSDVGTKVINAVIISPGGAVDRSFIMVDVY